MKTVYGSNEDVVKAYINKKVDYGRSGNIFFEGDVLYSYGKHFPMAVRKEDFYVVNADKYSATTGKHQGILFSLIPNSERLEIPFSALCSMAGLSYYNNVTHLIHDLNIICWEPDRYVKTNRLDKWGHEIYEHIMGGSVFKWKEKFYISGIDKTGVGARGRFFLTEFDNNAIKEFGVPKTMEEAYNLLKPEEVKLAEENRIEVKRQGEWFFVKAGNMDMFIEKKDIEKKYPLKHRTDKELAHIASEGCIVVRWKEQKEVQAVRGIIKHKRQEHKMLKLYEEGNENKDWYFAYESIQGGSWGASGNVD